MCCIPAQSGKSNSVIPQVVWLYLITAGITMFFSLHNNHTPRSNPLRHTYRSLVRQWGCGFRLPWWPSRRPCWGWMSPDLTGRENDRDLTRGPQSAQQQRNLQKRTSGFTALHLLHLNDQSFHVLHRSLQLASGKSEFLFKYNALAQFEHQRSQSAQVIKLKIHGVHAEGLPDIRNRIYD